MDSDLSIPSHLNHQKSNHPENSNRTTDAMSGGGGSLLSVVIPCFNESLNLKKFYTQVNQEIQKLIAHRFISACEFIFVNDGSTDATQQILEEMQEKHSDIQAICFSRNFGKEAAILAGLKAAKGEYITLMDADLQDPEWLLSDMFELISNGVDVVCVKRKNRSGDTLLRRVLSHWFYKIYGYVSDISLENGVRDFRLMKREVLEAVLSLNEYHRFSKGIFEWVGFTRAVLEYEYIPRDHGESSWNLWKLFKYGFGGMIGFSTMPLRLAFIIGFLVSMMALIYGCTIVIRTLLYGNPVSGYPSLICVVMFLGGIQLIVLGIIGEYIARIYEQLKSRPHYIIRNHKKRN